MTLTFVCVNVVRYMKRAQEFVIVGTTKKKAFYYVRV